MFLCKKIRWRNLERTYVKIKGEGVVRNLKSADVNINLGNSKYCVVNMRRVEGIQIILNKFLMGNTNDQMKILIHYKLLFYAFKHSLF